MFRLLHRWLLDAFKRLDSRFTDAATLHGRYCVSDAKLRHRGLSQAAARVAGH
ncbi:hypothetical protein FHS55_001956 [Angulomicrobium tetraedrale]|uniref:Uncharacterized protein n=1 Tax=Ancylobacter tetraedralis TaxID=217068 RepID=A0A839Z9L9_9HYPH|nr:hypothetical protein [Ancylobacter tetraedralis]MBB3771357.1 hypothetical protein [Ancylobacter tetraedralis]